MAKRRRKKPGYCVQCGGFGPITDDHVPPKLLFPEPKPKPSELIIVPSCSACNNGAGKDEEYFLAVLMFSDAGVSPAGSALWEQRLMRMYRNNLGLRTRIARSFTRLQIVTPAGLLLGHRFALRRDAARFERVINKIVKGLYFFEYKEALAQKVTVESILLNVEQETIVMDQFSHQLRLGSRSWPGIFEYCFNRVADQPEESIWLFSCYGSIRFWALTHSDGNGT